MKTRLLSLLAAGLLAVLMPFTASAQPALLAEGLQGGSGSTVGPDGALYVTEGALGRVLRVDPATGEMTTFASGLPPYIIGIGGAMDVAFIGETAYVLVTLVGADVGGSDAVGIYRIDGPTEYTIIADIGAHSLANPPTRDFEYFVPTGVHYSMEVFRGGLLVTDGHLNRVLWITTDGEISVLHDFDNIVPTGLDTWGNTVFLAQAGPVPHDAADGKIVSFHPAATAATEIAAGAPLMVDVKRGLGGTLYALAQGEWNGLFEGSPAIENDGRLLRVNGDGSFTEVATGLNIPTSFQVVGKTAYVVTLGGEIWTVDLSGAPYGKWGLAPF